MRILNVINSMNPESGGVCQVLRDTIPALKKMGVDSEVLCFDDSEDFFLSKDDFVIYAIGPSKGPYSFCPKLSKWLNEHMASYTDIIIHGLWLYNNYGTYRIWRKYRNSIETNLYIMPHGMLDPYFQKAEERKFKALRNLIFWKFIESKAVNGCDGILFTCEEELLLARKPFKPYSPKAEINVGLGTTAPPDFELNFLDKFNKKLKFFNDEKYFLFLSRIHQKKGVDLLIKAYLKLLKSNPSIPDLVIAGPGLDTEYGLFIKKMATHKKIHFPGMLTGDFKWGAFYGCEAFILPSHQENFGIAVAEALACKKPVLISDKINIWREVKTRGGGFIFSDSAGGAYQGIKSFMNLNSQEKIVMGDQAFKTYKTYFSVEKAARNMKNKLKLASKKKVYVIEDKSTDLTQYNSDFGLKNKLARLLWNCTYVFLFKPFGTRLFKKYRVFILRCFKAKIPYSSHVYANVKIWAPWNLTMGAHSTLGPKVDCYNQGSITIGANTIISQKTYLCASTHDFEKSDFPLICKPIIIGDSVWVAANAFVGPGVVIQDGAVVGARASVFKKVDSWTVVGGNPARFIKERVLKAYE